MTRKPRRKNNSRGDLEAQPQDEETSQRGAREMSAPMSGRIDKSSGALLPAVQANREGQARSQSQARKDGPSNSGDRHQPGDPGDTTQPIPSELPRSLIGDFDDSANALWSLHLKEAKSHDEARIHSLKDDMDGVLLFAGLFSAALTSFIIDKIQDLQVDPAQQMVYYQQQNVALLVQISNQVSSLAPQVSIPSTPPPPYPTFSPTSTDVRVNAFWFMSLVSSLSAALLATLVQQWVRDYMHVFKRYSNPLKSARLRQYLYEGAEGWYMPLVAESVPGLVHVSLFLFFLGLGDSLLSVHTTVAITTIVPITICGLLYIFSMFAPIINPQSPFRNPFSSLIWYVIRKVHPRTYLDRASSGALKTVSLKMSEGQVQLAMEENNKRKGRDVQAIQWLIDNSTEDDEMESFTMAIPGTFTSKWGVEVWRKVSEVKQYEQEYEDASSRPNGLAVGSQTDADLRVSVLQRHVSPRPQHTSHLRNLLRLLGHAIGIRIANSNPHDVAVVTRSTPPPNGGQALNKPQAARDPTIDDLFKRGNCGTSVHADVSKRWRYSCYMLISNWNRLGTFEGCSAN
ncbi:hypothetical protein EDB87DRAFT_311134 [Lactarius vividus]|nr:hypothetical protein EDB87DRAFT_311134 [Lactarius vividus]